MNPSDQVDPTIHISA